MCCWSIFRHGGNWPRSTFRHRLIPSVPPHFALSISKRASLTLLYMPLPYIAVVNSSNLSFNPAGTSHVSPYLDNVSWNPLFFSSTLIGRMFPIPLNALVVSQWVNTWRDIRAVHNSSPYAFDRSEISLSFLLFPEPVSKRILMSNFDAWCSKMKNISLSGLWIHTVS